MRVCWNRQTGTFEGRVSMTYEFKSRHSHQRDAGPNSPLGSALFFSFAARPQAAFFCRLFTVESLDAQTRS